MKHVPIEERFWARVGMGPAGCWAWLGFVHKGYGRLANGKNPLRAHRFSYELHNGAISGVFVVDHLCRNTRCVNPEHLEAVTQEENMRRSIARCAKVTHCPAGHVYDQSNTSVRTDGERRCKTCARAYSARRRSRNSSGA